MGKHVLVIAATAFVAWGASTAGAQDYPDYATREQPQVVQQRQELERELERAQSPRRSVESDNDQDDGGGMTRLEVPPRLGPRNDRSRHDGSGRDDGPREYGVRHDDANDLHPDGQRR